MGEGEMEAWGHQTAPRSVRVAHNRTWLGAAPEDVSHGGAALLRRENQLLPKPSLTAPDSKLVTSKFKQASP